MTQEILTTFKTQAGGYTTYRGLKKFDGLKLTFRSLD